MSRTSVMAMEAQAAPEVVRAQLDRNAGAVRELGALLRTLAPRAVITCARGSSDHAASFAKYLIESRTGALTSSAAPSVSSLYEASQDLRGAIFLAISQSGRSPDLLAATHSAKAAGACVIALCNDAAAPLAALAHHCILLHAGPESSIAATKTFVASLSALIHLVAHWSEDHALETALLQAPELLAQAWRMDWSAAIAPLQGAQSMFVIGRGFGLGAAQEAALKLKETCGLHAEAFSAAEVKHGPMAIVTSGFPVLMFSQHDQTQAGVQELAADFVARGARVLIAGAQVSGAVQLSTLPSHPVIEPMLLVQSFYRMAADLALARGVDPDAPPHLKKITETR